MKRAGSILALMIAGFTSLALCADEANNVLSGSSVPIRIAAEDLRLTGNLRVDLFGRRGLAAGFQFSDQIEGEEPHPRKSPWLAAGMSLVLPGAGEFYSESYWRSAGFFVLEVAAWTVAYTYDKKGDRQTDSFQNYADAHWNVVQYAMYAQSLAPAGQYNWLRTDVPASSPPWERVNWPELNRMERDIGRYYSHTLPFHGEQQYYELIGKYYQFNQGWQDVTLIPGEAGQINTYYEKERANADDFYNTASTVVSLAIVNHLLSAVDAALSATSFNRVHASVGLQKLPDGALYVRVPTVKLLYAF